MQRPSLLSLLAATLALLLAPVRLAADLVWTPQEGWKVEGGVAGGNPAMENTNALNAMNAARAAEEAGEYKKALQAYTVVSKHYPNSVFAPEALYRQGTVFHKRREYYKAFLTFHGLLARYPNTERFNQVIGSQYRIASELSVGKRPLIWGWLPGFKNRDRALEYFEIIVATAPYSDYAPLSLMNAARGYRQIGEVEVAIDALDRMINTYPRSILTPDAYLKIAQAHASLVDGPYYDQASTKQAITYYEDYMILFPGDTGMIQAEKGLDDMKTTLAESKLTIANYYLKHRRNYKAAKVFYNEAITVYPDSAVAAEARSKLVEIDAMLGLTSAAVVQPGAQQPAEPKKKRFWLF